MFIYISPPLTKKSVLHLTQVFWTRSLSSLLRFVIFEPTCTCARWAHMHRFLSVRLSSWLDQNTDKTIIYLQCNHFPRDGQGHAARSYFWPSFFVLRLTFEGSKVCGCPVRVPNNRGWPQDNVRLLCYYFGQKVEKLNGCYICRFCTTSATSISWYIVPGTLIAKNPVDLVSNALIW